LTVLISAALLLASCAAVESGAAADLMQISSRAPTNYRTVECVAGAVVKEFSSQASIDYGVERVLYSGDDVGKLVDLYTFNRQPISKGDLIAEIELDVVMLSDELEKLRLNVENAETFLALEMESIRDGIAEMTAALADTGPREAEVLKLRIEKAKLEYEYYVYDAELKINGWKKEMAEINEKLLGVKIYAPTDGFVTGLTTISRGEAIEPGTVVLYIYFNDNFRFQFTAETSNFRYNMDVDIIVANDLSYPGRIISDPLSENPDGGSMEFKVELVTPPDDPLAFLNLISNRRITISGKAVELTGVPVLPYNSIYNENGRRYVMLLEDNIVKKRYVQIGLFTNQTAEIVSGVRLGDLILE